ncbi:MAG: acyltransferase, partial [Ferruginibacter sp.]|nr:acyltransferase [Ferruginibacter sp.]
MPQNAHEKKFTYLPSLDGIRGIAVIFVMMLHGSYNYFKGGWIGVDLFFVLSGYLITSLLQTEYESSGNISLKNFYIRRALRLFPALIISVLLANLLWNISTPYFYDIGNQNLSTAGALFYFINILPKEITGNLGHLWSLCVEEHFYILWPVTAILLFKLHYRQRIVFLSVIIAVITILRIVASNYYFSFFNGAIQIDPYRFTFCRADNIMAGCLLAYILNHKKKNVIDTVDKKKSTFLLLICFLLFAVILFTIDIVNRWWLNGGFILTNLLCVATILLAVKNPSLHFLSNKILHWIGVRAYGIYLYHRIIFYPFEGLRVEHSPVNFILVSLLRIGATLVVVYFSYRFIEQPVL